MSDFENNQILTHLRESQAQLESVNQKFKQIEVELKASGQSLEHLYMSHKNHLELADQRRVNENLFQQLNRMQHDFANVQNGIAWFGMQMAVFMATLERAAFFVASERQAMEAKKRDERGLTEDMKFRHLREEKAQRQLEDQRIAEMAEKARTYPYPSPTPFHFGPYRKWPY